MHSEVGKSRLLCCFPVLIRKLVKVKSFGWCSKLTLNCMNEQWGGACLSSGGCSDVRVESV